MPDKLQKADPFISVRIPEYRNLMTGRFLFIVGLRMMGTLVGWWITTSPTIRWQLV